MINLFLTCLFYYYSDPRCLIYNKGIEPDLQPVYEQFLMESLNHGFYLNLIPISIQFQEIEDPATLAVCYIGYHTLIVDPKKYYAWGAAYPVYREYLLFHELGHCLLNLPHSDSGVMFYAIDGLQLQKYANLRQIYIDDLFKINFDATK